MMPLCTTTIRPLQSWWGWAFSSVGRPCVAQRVCPSPQSPASGSRSRLADRFASLPAERRRTIEPSLTTAIPAES